MSRPPLRHLSYEPANIPLSVWGNVENLSWRALLLQILSQENPARVRELCSRLEVALFERFQEIAGDVTPENMEERSEMLRACERLAAVLIETLGFPAWEYSLEPETSATGTTMSHSRRVMNDTHSNWERLLQDVLQERDREKLTAKVDALEAEIFERYQELELRLDVDAERSRLKKATEQLFKIKTEKLGLPIYGPTRFGGGDIKH